MPELPEVEQVRRSLEPHILGKKIENVRVDRPKMVHGLTPEAFAGAVTGATFARVDRRGKFLRLYFTDGRSLLAHLRMTGALLAGPKDEPEPPFTRVAFTLSGDENLYFSDIRVFGTLELLDAGATGTGLYADLGPEPLEEAMNAQYLRAKAKGKTTFVKPFILDQTVIAGLGNIYADESLFAAGLRPTHRVNRITKAQWEALALAIKQVIAQGLEHHGTTFRNYQDADGQMGDNMKYLQVYHRKGEPCNRCGTPLVQKKVGGRGSVYCPKCQK